MLTPGTSNELGEVSLRRCERPGLRHGHKYDHYFQCSGKRAGLCAAPPVDKTSSSNAKARSDWAPYCTDLQRLRQRPLNRPQRHGAEQLGGHRASLSTPLVESPDSRGLHVPESQPFAVGVVDLTEPTPSDPAPVGVPSPVTDSTAS